MTTGVESMTTSIESMARRCEGVASAYKAGVLGWLPLSILL